MNIKVYCDCGTELKIGGKTRITHLNEILLITEPCSNKKCDKGFCGNCEDMVRLNLLEDLTETIGQQQIQKASKPECFGNYQRGQIKCKQCKVHIACYTEKTRII